MGRGRLTGPTEYGEHAIELVVGLVDGSEDIGSVCVLPIFEIPNRLHQSRGKREADGGEILDVDGLLEQAEELAELA